MPARVLKMRAAMFAFDWCARLNRTFLEVFESRLVGLQFALNAVLSLLDLRHALEQELSTTTTTMNNHE